MQELKDEAIAYRVEATKRLIEGLAKSNQETRDVLEDVFAAKIRDAVDLLKITAHANLVKDKKETAGNIAKWSRALRAKDDKVQGSAENREKTEALILRYIQLQEENDGRVHYLETTHADLALDYFRRCMGIYMERRYRTDDLHVESTRISITHMNITFENVIDQEEDPEVLIDVIQEYQERLDKFVDSTLMENIVSNAEIVEDLRELKLKDGAEPFIR